MRRSGFIDKLSVTASIVLAVTLCTSLGVVFWPRVTSALGIKPEPPAPAYAVGDLIDVPSGWYARTPKTLVVFARASCGACETAQPFLKTLVASVAERGGSVAFAGHRETPADDAVFARSLGLPDKAFAIFPAGLRVRVTPTLVVVNREGTVLHAWEGVGPPEKQHVIAAAVDAAFK